MIGQFNTFGQIENWIRAGEFPRFLIICGARGSGKSLLAYKIAKMLNAFYIPCELGVDAAREAVENCYRCNGTTVYSFLNADKMSVQAKNALLKITEEPPRSAHFIMTLQDPGATLETLRSRGTMLSMEPYTSDELRHYMGDNVNETIIKIAATPGDVDALLKINPEQFYSFCEKVLDNIGLVTGVNAFKIAQSLRFKEEGEGHDPILFMRCVSAICFDRVRALGAEEIEWVDAYSKLLKYTSECIRDLQMNGVKKDSTVDMWILKVRGAINDATD